MSDLGVIEDGAVAMSDGVITHVGPTEEVLRDIHAEDYLEIRAENQAVLPGFVDSHTHFIFGGYREEEFSWRLRGEFERFLLSTFYFFCNFVALNQ